MTPDDAAAGARLERFVADGSAALLIIDMQNDFCHEDGSHGRRGADLGTVQRIVEPVGQLLDAARPRGVPVIFVRTHRDRWTASEHTYIRQTPTGMVYHLQPGGWGSDFYGIAPTAQDYVLVKRRYSAFFGTELEIMLRNLGIECLIVCGVATNVCVDTTVRDACMRDLDTIVIRDCVAAFSQEAHEAALQTIQDHFGRVVDLDEVMSALRSDAAAPAPVGAS